MSQSDKRVFISYRRPNSFHAQAVFRELRAHGYDVFIEQGVAFNMARLLNELKARKHFIIILTLNTLDQWNNFSDPLRIEIETAIDHNRHIIPLLMDGFEWHHVPPALLTGKLAMLSGVDGLKISTDGFDEAMVRLRTQFLEGESLSPFAIKEPFTTPEKLMLDTRLYDTPTPNIFISHSTKDAPSFVTPLYQALLATHKYTLFKAPETILAGETWVNAIERGLSNMTYMLLILSPSSVASPWVNLEVETAIERERRGEITIIPVPYIPTNLPLLWGRFQQLVKGNTLKDTVNAILNRIPYT
jgi:hypothetical protein